MRVPARFAYAAALLFAAHLITYFIPALRDATLASAPAAAVALAILALAQHAVVFPVAAALPTPSWARIAAYVWLIGDMVSDLMQMAGSPVSQYLMLRLTVNVLAALWIAMASLRGPGAMRGVGLFVALDLVLYSLAALFDQSAYVVALPSLVLLPIWFALVGRLFTRMAAAPIPTPTAG